MAEEVIPLSSDVDHIVGTTPTLLTRPTIQSGGIVKTVRGGAGQHTSFAQEGPPRHSVKNLVLFADSGNWRFKIGNFVPQTFDEGDLDGGADTLTIVDNGLLDLSGPFQLIPDPDTSQLPTGLHPQKATQDLVFAGQPGNTETVVIDGKTYTFQTTLTDSDGNVQIGGDAEESRDNLIAAINLGAGSGTAYAASTTLHPTVAAGASGTDTLVAFAKLGGTAGNDIEVSDTVTNADWDDGNLAGGTAAVDYFLRKVDDDVLQFATSRANALAGTVVDFGAPTAGNFTISGTFNIVEDPSVSVLDGSGAVLLPQGQSIVLEAHQFVTAVGFDAAAVLTVTWAG